MLEKLKAYVATMKNPSDIDLINDGELDNGDSFITIKISY